MEVIVRVNNQSNGRDKLARLIQYTSRLVWHQLETRNANKYTVDRVRNLELALSSFRKILRMGRCVDICYTALNSLHIEDPWLRFTLMISKLAHSIYLYADHIVWLTRSGFLKADSEKWNKTANKFWLLSIIANLARDFYEILQILDFKRNGLLKSSQLIDGISSNYDFSGNIKHLYTVVKCHKDIFIDTLKNSCDLFIPLTALGFTKLSPSVIGTLGAISSLAALITIVNPITKLVPV